MACLYDYKRGQGAHGLDQSRETDLFDGEDDLPGVSRQLQLDNLT